MNKNKLLAYMQGDLDGLYVHRPAPHDTSIDEYEHGWFKGAISELQALTARIERGEFDD